MSSVFCCVGLVLCIFFFGFFGGGEEMGVWLFFHVLLPLLWQRQWGGVFLQQDQCSSFSVKGKPMVINAIRFLLIVYFLPALSYNLPRMNSHGLQMTLFVYWTVLAEAFPSALFTKDALCVLAPQVPVLESLDGSSYPCHTPGEGTSPSLTFFEQTTKHLSLTCVQWVIHVCGSSAGSCG